MEVDNETQSVVDYAIADQEFMALVSAAARSALAFTVAGIQSYTYVPGPPSMPDGKERSGMLTVKQTGQAKYAGSQCVFKMINCSSSEISYSCDSIVVTTNETNNDYASFNVKLINGVCKTSGYSIKYRFDRTFTIYPGFGALYTDVVCYVYGVASGTNRNNGNFSINVLQGSSLVKRANCPYIRSGIMELTPEGFKTRSVNFGDGTCDDLATFTVKENTVAFKLK